MTRPRDVHSYDPVRLCCVFDADSPVHDTSRRCCDDCLLESKDLIRKTDHHGGTKTVCRDRDACHARSPD